MEYRYIYMYDVVVGVGLGFIGWHVTGRRATDRDTKSSTEMGCFCVCLLTDGGRIGKSGIGIPRYQQPTTTNNRNKEHIYSLWLWVAVIHQDDN